LNFDSFANSDTAKQRMLLLTIRAYLPICCSWPWSVVLASHWGRNFHRWSWRWPWRYVLAI